MLNIVYPPDASYPKVTQAQSKTMLVGWDDVESEKAMRSLCLSTYNKVRTYIRDSTMFCCRIGYYELTSEDHPIAFHLIATSMHMIELRPENM